ncbi:uncharacterized protein MELLADRAFT_114737 [Melampsora larici-populina 98AG31]|uniref:Uncharacterized protein n=1 Tax=Melampsora larici-populina (strain 98AG31 / pathotype 3-4-7) TaxID=747676 RepID=F4SEK6_MELLP|nr:uncharacterized protein MELLADRAFT_114737 [Melampsora larici-populina 98AG31]EGF96918.1 hypothetical protein MELLADRAFT_114737 [Melampsora larici-populina 98AG31]
MTLQENQHITLPLVSCKWTYDQEKTMIETADRMQSANKSFRNETSSEHLKSLSSDQSNQELRQEKLGSETAHDLSISLMADSSILSNKSTKKRKFVKEKSASNEDVQGRLTSAVSTIRSSESVRKNPRKSTAQLFIDSMESMQDIFLNKMNVDLTASPSGSMKAPLEYVAMAVDLLQKMKNLDTELLFKALDLFKDQQEYAAMFVGLQNQDLRIDWLKYKLERLWSVYLRV